VKIFDLFRDKTPGRELKLPAWAKAVPGSDKVGVRIEADTAGYVADWFEKLDVKKADQYWLEVAYQCAKMQLQDALIGTEYDPRVIGKPAEFHFTRSSEHALARHPTGRGARAATQGREAREHFKRVHGRLPW
jgi:hypothetical protein